MDMLLAVNDFEGLGQQALDRTAVDHRAGGSERDPSAGGESAYCANEGAFADRVFAPDLLKPELFLRGLGLRGLESCPGDEFPDIGEQAVMLNLVGQLVGL